MTKGPDDYKSGQADDTSAPVGDVPAPDDEQAMTTYSKKPNKTRRVGRLALTVIVIGLLTGSALYAYHGLQGKVSWLPRVDATPEAKVSVPKVAASIAPTPDIPTTLESDWATAMSGREGSVDIGVYDRATGQIAHYTNTGGTFYTASIVKLSILEELLLQDQGDGQTLTGSQLEDATPMIENSNNDAASDLWDLVGGATAMANFFQQVGATSTTPGADDEWGLTQTTALDQLKVVNALAYPGTLLTSASATSADALLDQVEADQRWGVSGGVPTGVAIELKDGWLQYPTNWIINSIGHVHGDGQDYTIAVLTAGNPTEQYGMDTVESLSSVTWQALAAL